MRSCVLRSLPEFFRKASRLAVATSVLTLAVVPAGTSALAVPEREINVHFRGMATLPVDFGPQVLAVRTRLGVPATGLFRLANLTGSPLAVKARFVTRPAAAAKAYEPIGAFPVTRLRPHESRTVSVRFTVRRDLDVHTPEIYVEYTLEPAR